MDYSDHKNFIHIIGDCLSRFPDLANKVLEGSELRVIWFQFNNEEEQRTVLSSVYQHVTKETVTWENSIVPITKAAGCQLYVSSEMFKKTFKDVSDGNMMRSIEAITERGEGYVLLCTDPTSKKENRTLSWLILGSSPETPEKLLLETLNHPKGLDLMLTMYQDRIDEMKPWKHCEKKRFARIMYTFMIKDRCRSCGSTNCTKRCSACKTARYCNEECQKVNWEKHKQYCSIEASIRDFHNS